MKGITIGDSISYRSYDGAFHGVPLLFAEPKGNMASPRSLAMTASELNAKFHLPVVFLFSSCPAYERQRLIDKGLSLSFCHCGSIISPLTRIVNMPCGR